VTSLGVVGKGRPTKASPISKGVEGPCRKHFWCRRGELEGGQNSLIDGKKTACLPRKEEKGGGHDRGAPREKGGPGQESKRERNLGARKGRGQGGEIKAEHFRFESDGGMAASEKNWEERIRTNLLSSKGRLGRPGRKEGVSAHTRR